MVYNLTTDTKYPAKFQELFNLQHNSLDEKFAREVLYCNDMQWGNRRIARVVENNFAYFAVRRISESRDLNLFQKRLQRELCNSQPLKYFIMTQVLVAVSHQYCIIFNAETLMLETHREGSGFKARSISAQDKQTQMTFCWDKKQLLVIKDIKGLLQIESYDRGDLDQVNQIMFNRSAVLVLTNAGELVLFQFEEAQSKSPYKDDYKIIK